MALTAQPNLEMARIYFLENGNPQSGATAVYYAAPSGIVIAFAQSSLIPPVCNRSGGIAVPPLMFYPDICSGSKRERRIAYEMWLIVALRIARSAAGLSSRLYCGDKIIKQHKDPR